MTLQEFISAYSNKPTDFDGIYPNMCIDLMHWYIYSVLGLTDKTIMAATSAYRLYTDFDTRSGKQFFQRITNSIEGVPLPGDIVIWGQEIGPDGHVAIFVSGDAQHFQSFDSNWPAGSLPHLQQHDYHGVLGWLHPLADSITEVTKPLLDSQSVQDQLRKERDDNWILYQKQIETANIVTAQLSDEQTKTLGLQKDLTEVKSKYDEEVKETIALNDALSKLTQSNKDYRSEAYNCSLQLKDEQNYLYALADHLGVKRSGMTDSDLSEACLKQVEQMGQTARIADQTTDALNSVAEKLQLPKNLEGKQLGDEIIRQVKRIQGSLPSLPFTQPLGKVTPSSPNPTIFARLKLSWLGRQVLV